MRIALLGAPETGKTKLARALAKEHELDLVDGYIQKLQKATGLALGPWSSYSEHFMIAGHRLAAEEKVGSDKRITVTTIIDTITYAAVKSDISLGNTQKDRTAMYLSAQAAMQGLGLIYTETWDYDMVFWLPYNEAQLVEKNGTWEAALDNAYTTVVESFNVPYAFVIEGDHNDRLRIINETIELIKNAQETSETD